MEDDLFDLGGVESLVFNELMRQVGKWLFIGSEQLPDALVGFLFINQSVDQL